MLPQTTPESVGFSLQRLQLLTERIDADVERGNTPGAVVLVARHGRIAYFKAFGYRERAKQTPMQLDSVFRIASMTKPITAVAALMLLEEGKLQLIEPVSRYLPELKNLQVGVEYREGTGDRRLVLQPAKREGTVQDLMRHTAGYTYGIFGDSLVQRAYRAAALLDDQQTNAEMTTKLAQLPLAYSPGTTFEYGMSSDVLGRIVEVVAEKDLATFFTERIAQPLHMRDTAFVLNTEQTNRLAEPQSNGMGGPPIVVGYNPAKPPKWFSGGAGLLSTALDYAHFCQMLLNGGELDGVRLLSRKTVELMRSNHLPPGVAFGPFVQELGMTAPLPEFGQGYGLAVGMRMEQGKSTVPGSVGDFYWGGATGPYFWIDPVEDLFAVLMLQELNVQTRTYYRSLMRNLVYQALN